MREKMLFDDNWKFHKGDIKSLEPELKGPVYIQAKTERKRFGPACIQYVAKYDDYSTDIELNPLSWKDINLPHDYIIEDMPEEKNNNTLGYYQYENAWYRKEFFISADDKDKRICLLFEGVAVNATVYFNGCLMGHNFCGYTSFETDITDYVEFDRKNVLAVFVDATSSHEGWWYEGGGIYRHVWLIKTDKISVDLWGVYVNPEYKNGKWDLHIENTVRNDSYETAEVEVVTKISDERGELLFLSGKCSIAPMTKSTVNLSGAVKKPHLWDLDDPHQYKAVTYIYHNGAETDAYETKFGFRYFSYSPESGFSVNGKKTFINGVCAHQDFGLTGKAVPDNIQKHKIKLIKEMGANGFRCSHYPHSEATMDALDETGFIVMAETRWFESTKEGMEQLEMLIKRDRNRPSVFFWSTGNEEPKQITDSGKRINRKLIERIRQLDNSRYIVCAVSNNPEKATIFEDLDVIGINYNHHQFEEIHKKYPEKMMIASECCATSTTRGWYYDDNPQKGYYNAIDKDTNEWFIGREHMWKFFKKNPWIAGGYQWIAFEHRGECYWPRICSQAGAIDLFMQKKDAFYQNQSLFISDRPVIHLLPHWNFEGLEGESIRVVAYTNCDEAELFVNGKCFGKRVIDKPGHAEWQVPYEKGTIKVIGLNGGKPVAEDSRTTTEKPVRLMLKLENEAEANGRDIALVSCFCVDEDGREVPNASPYVKFTSNSLGTIVATGSDVCDHIPPKCSDRQMRAGRISVAVLAGEKAGVLKLYAEAENLKSAVLDIELS